MNSNNFGYPQPSNMPGYASFNPMSSNSMMGHYPGVKNPSQQFAPGRTMIPQPNFKNPGNLRHNNVGDDVLSGEVVEYRLYIDTIDRDKKFSNPFKVSVDLRPSSTQMAPYIDHEFKNVKYVRLDMAILPRYSKFTKNTLTEALVTSWGTNGDTMLAMTASDGTTITQAILDGYITTDGFDEGDPIDDTMRHNYIKQKLITSDFITHIQTVLADDLAAVQNGTKAIEDVKYKGVQYESFLEKRSITRIYAPSVDYDYYFDPVDTAWYVYTKDTSSSSLLYDDRYVILVIDEFANKQVHGTNRVLGESFGLLYPDREFNDHFYQGGTFQSSVVFPDGDLQTLSRISFRLYDVEQNQLVFSHVNSSDSYSTKDPRHPLHKHLQLQFSLVIGEMQPYINRDPGYRA